MGEHRDDSGRKWLAIAVIFVAFWVLYLAFFGPKGRRPELAGTALADPANFDWTFRDLKDQPATFATFKGKPVFLNIWATWCPPCVREMPSIARLADEPRLKGKGIAFVCVSVDDSTEAVRQFVQGQPWHMTFFRAANVPPVFATEGIPATFIIAPDGRIAASEIGAADWDTPEVIALLEKLAAEAPRTP